jgi:hypothetical protein
VKAAIELSVWLAGTWLPYMGRCGCCNPTEVGTNVEPGADGAGGSEESSMPAKIWLATIGSS